MRGHFLSFLLFLGILCTGQTLIFGQFADDNRQNVAGSSSSSSVNFSNLVQQKLLPPFEQFELYSFDPNAFEDWRSDEIIPERYPLSLTYCEYEIKIEKGMAETTISLSMAVDSWIDVEGVLNFSLPPGVSPDGFSLFVEKIEVEGVAVEKNQAKNAYETIVSRRVDPGLLEWLGDGNFRLHVYPIIRGEPRNVKIRYVQPISGNTLRIPLKYPAEIENFVLKIRSDFNPETTVGELGQFGQDEAGKWFVSAMKKENYRPKGDIVLNFPKNAAPKPRFGKSNDGETYFAYPLDLTAINEKIAAEPTPFPSRVAVYWDASGSQNQAENAKKVEFLKKFLEGKETKVDLVVFRDTIELLKTFETVDKTFFNALDAIQYDGATNLELLSFRETQAELALLFSDGVSSIGTKGGSKRHPQTVPIHVFASGQTLNRSYLGSLAANSGGKFFDLNLRGTEEILAELQTSEITLLYIEPLDKNLEELELSRISGNKTPIIAGRMQGDTTWMRLHFGSRGKVLETTVISIEAEGKIRQDEVPRRIWAQMKLHSLLAYGKANYNVYSPEHVLEHGLKYGLVTPETSLISLESGEDYFEFGIEPPESAQDIFKNYHYFREAHEEDERARNNDEEEKEEIERIRKAKEEREKIAAKIVTDRLVDDWTITTKWWSHKFEYLSNNYFNRQFSSAREAFGTLTTRSEKSLYEEHRFRLYGPRSSRYPESNSRMSRDSWDNFSSGGGYGNNNSNSNSGGSWGGFLSSGSSVSAGASTGRDEDVDESTSGRDYSGIMFETRKEITLENLDLKVAFLDKIAVARKLSKAEAYSTYLKFRQQYGQSPLFYLECHRIFLKAGDEDLAERIIGNVHELGYSCESLNRYLVFFYSHRNSRENAIAMLESISMYPNTDLIYTKMKFAKNADEYRDILEYYAGQFDDFKYFHASTGYDNPFLPNMTELIELNRLIAKSGIKDIPFDKRLIEPLEFDIFITARNSPSDKTIRLSITEPHGEILRDKFQLSAAGGALSEETSSPYTYMIRNAPKGKYKVALETAKPTPAPVRSNRSSNWNLFDGFSDNEDGDLGWSGFGDEESETDDDEEFDEISVLEFKLPEVVILDIYTNYGRKNEKHRSIFLVLEPETELYELTEVDF